VKVPGSVKPGHWRWLLAGLLLAALLLRLHGIGFGLPALNDPDELMFELGAWRMLRGLTLNPGWFGHPATTTMQLLALVNIGVFVTGYLAGWFASIHGFTEAFYHHPGWVILPGRILMAIFAVGTIALVYRLASAMFDRSTGLAAAALLAVNPVHVTYSQIIRSDMMACCFMLLCVQAALRIARTGRWRDYVWASLWLGLAVATKWPFALAALAVGGAVAPRIREYPAERRSALIRLGLCFAMGLGFLLLISPYLLLDYPTVLRNLRGEAQIHHLGATGGTPWENGWWYIRHPLFTGLGTAGFLFFLCGAALLPGRREAASIIAPLALAFFLLLCVQHLVWERWALPLMPLAAIIAAPALVGLCRWLRQRLGRWSAASCITVALIATLLPPALETGTLARERRNDTRQQASRWAGQHITPDSTVMVEQFAFDLLPYPWHLLFPLGDAGCMDVRATLNGQINYAPIDGARGNRSIVDYGTLAPSRRDTCRADYAILTQYDRYRAEQAAFPDEAAAYQTLIAQGTVVATFAPVPGISAGPVVRIVRFARRGPTGPNP
jgi:4-amino-4-deoxy-L-arabinose transferase-like glycosyltransferase